MDEDEDIGFVGIVECPDCDTTIISDPEYISIFVGFGEIWAVSLCGYCERPVTDDISKELALEFAELGVKVFSWESGFEIGVAGVCNL